MHGDARPARRGSPRLASALLTMALVVGGLATSAELPAGAVEAGTPPPEAYILVDAGSGAVITGRNMHDALPPASTVKIMTALVAAERLPLDATVPVSELAASREAMKIGMQTGTAWPLDQTMATLMMISANDSAYALAEKVGGSISGFAKMANATAKRYGMRDSTFGDPAGLSDETAYDGGPQVSAYDLAIAARNALKVPSIARWAETKNYDFTDVTGLAHTLTNHDKFLPDNGFGYVGANGFKTGYTQAANHTLVATAKRGGRQCIAVILGGVDSGYTWAASLLDQCWVTPKVKTTGKVLPAIAVSPYATRVAARTGFTDLAVGKEGAKLAAATSKAPTAKAAATPTTVAAATTVAPASTGATASTGAPAPTAANDPGVQASTTAAQTDQKKTSSSGPITMSRVLLLLLLGLIVAFFLRRRAVQRQRARRIARQRARAKAMRSGSLPVVDGRYRTGMRTGQPVESRVRVRRGHIDLTQEERRPTRSTRPAPRPRAPRTPESAD